MASLVATSAGESLLTGWELDVYEHASSRSAIR